MYTFGNEDAISPTPFLLRLRVASLHLRYLSSNAKYDTRDYCQGSLRVLGRCLHRILLAPLIPHRGLRFGLFPYGSQHAVPEGGEGLGEVCLSVDDRVSYRAHIYNNQFFLEFCSNKDFLRTFKPQLW